MNVPVADLSTLAKVMVGCGGGGLQDVVVL